LTQLPNIQLVVLEYWDVYPDKLAQFKDWATKYYHGSLSNAPGYVGMTYMALKPGADEITFGRPASGQVITYHPMVAQLGTVTNASVNFNNLLKNEYNVCMTMLYSDASVLGTLFEYVLKGFEKLRPGWRQDHPDLNSAVEVMEREFFSMVKNHWDVFLDVQSTLWNRTPVEAGTIGAIS
jgi:hypothetical protein